MKYFEKFASNTCAGSGNQLCFGTEGEIRTGRIFYKISAGGEYNYSVLFSNIIDSTFADGSAGHKNLICDEWEIHGARIGKCKKWNKLKSITELVMTDDENSEIEVLDFKEITFGGARSKSVMPGEFFASDPIKLCFEKGEYLCIEMSFSGDMIPYHEETMLPVYVKEDGKWKYSKHLPFAGMVGCDRQVKAKIAYLGDSITQGCGTELNGYLHWNALLSEKLGSEYSYWNLGLGYGRANDAASDGAWLYKAKQSDVVFVCYGVNDILKGQPEETIKADLTCIVKKLKENDIRVIIQTVPPFDYEGENIGIWKRINSYILEEFKDKVDFIFDNTGILGKKEAPEQSVYNGHPNEEGCAVWADALYEAIKKNNIL